MRMVSIKVLVSRFANIALSLAFLLLAACATSPASVSAAKEYYSLALLYEGQKDTANAVAMYKKALQLQPTFRMAQYNLAQVYIIRGEFDNARVLLDALATADPSNQAVAETQAYLAAKQGKLEDALAAYKKILTVTEGRAQVLYNLALLCRELDRLDDAYAYASRLIALLPDEPAYARLAGFLALKLDKKDDAERQLSRFAKSIEKDPVALTGFAQDLEDQSYHARALDILEKVIALDGKNVPAMLLKIRILANGANDPDRAKTTLRSLMQIGGADDLALTALLGAVPPKQTQDYLDVIKEFKKDFQPVVTTTTTTTTTTVGTATTGTTVPGTATTPTTIH